jgi:hypothetical protein
MSELIRPFRGLDRLGDYLESHVLRFVNGAFDRPRATLTSDAVRGCDARISLQLETAGLEMELKRAGLLAKDVEIIAYRISATRRLTEYPARIKAGDGGKTIEIDAGRQKDSTGDLLYREGSGFTLGIAFVLANSRPPEPLRPFLKGTWLADAKLEVHSREESMDGITPLKLTPERLAELQEQGSKVGPGTITFIQFTGKVLETEVQQCMDLYVHEDLGNAMDSYELNPGSIDESRLRFQVARMSVDVITAIACKVYLELLDEDGLIKPADAAVEEALKANAGLASFLAKPVRKSGGQGARTDVEISTELIKLAGTAPDELRSYVEDCYGLGKHLNSTLGR